MAETDTYEYELPRELIAQQPLRRRSDARLMVVDRRDGTLQHVHVRDLPDILNPGDCLVINDTQVIPARLVGYRTRTGGAWSGLFLSTAEEGLWRVMSKTRGKLTKGETVTLVDRQSLDSARLFMLADLGDGVWAARPEPAGPAFELLERLGRVPLPPYIRGGEMVDSDRSTYQTVFADKPGAVAAPTAGLHFSPELLSQLDSRGVGVCRLTLHVGPGTFRPITAERIGEHRMHAEWGCIQRSAIDQLEAHRGGRIVAVGTTSVRVLETAAMSGTLRPWQGNTELFIRPPFEFQVTQSLMTNFHLPKTTLLVLVHTFGGSKLMRKAYQEAIREEYRFYSYGDTMLIL